MSNKHRDYRKADENEEDVTLILLRPPKERDRQVQHQRVKIDGSVPAFVVQNLGLITAGVEERGLLNGLPWCQVRQPHRQRA